VSRRMPSDQRGFTLIELMVALTIFSFAIAGVLAVATSMTQAYREQRNVIAAEGAVRVPLDYITDTIRQLSPGVPGLNIVDADTCSLSALTITNSTSAPDVLDIIFASGGVVTSTTSPLVSTSTTLTVVDASQLAAGDYVVVSNMSAGVFYRITNVTGTTLTLSASCSGATLATNYPASLPAGSLVVRSQHVTFTIALLDGTSALWMDPDAGGPLAAEPLAEGVEDLQVAVGIDQAADGLLDNGTASDEWIYNAAGDTPTILPPAVGTVRAVRVSMVAKTALAQIGGGPTFTRPALEDRPASAGDYFRRRTLRSTIEIRSAGVSP
jgi:prepilin-type N-terminal cleavage/methylation domain-containing protein